MRNGVQSLGWYVLRAPDPVPLIRFYRDILGLSELRGRETPPEDASAMLWAGGTTVFEPNRLRSQRGTGETYSTIDTCPFIPVFQSVDPDATRKRLDLEPVTVSDGTAYFQDPLGFFFALETGNGTHEGLTPPGIKPLAEDLLCLSRLEMRVSDPVPVTAFYRDTLGLKEPGQSKKDTFLDLGDGAVLDIKPGGRPETIKISDREDAAMVPVFRLYGYDHFKAKMEEKTVPCLQEVDLTGGRIWYGWDPAGHLFGFQERRPPDPSPDKWTTRLPEDLMARRMWDSA